MYRSREGHRCLPPDDSIVYAADGGNVTMAVANGRRGKLFPTTLVEPMPAGLLAVAVDGSTYATYEEGFERWCSNDCVRVRVSGCGLKVKNI